MSRHVRTGCPYCGVGCGLVAEVEGSRLVKVSGDPDHPVNKGATCRKPLALPEAVAAPDRATAPMRRDSAGHAWQEVTWRRAISEVASKLKDIRSKHGPGSIAFYISGQLLTEDYYAVNKLAKGFIGTPNLDSNSRLCMSSAVAGYRAAFGSDGPPPSYSDIEQTDCLLVLGSNTAACHPIVWAAIRRRQQQGANLIMVDPRATDAALASDLHLPVKPGTDLPLLNAMLNVLASEGMIDERFIERHTQGFEDTLAAAAEWTPQRAAQVCGISAESIVEAARRFGSAKRAMCLWSMGANQSTVGTLKNQALNNLCLATGNIGRPGAGPLSLTGQPNAMGGRETGGMAGLLPGYRFTTDADHRAETRRLWGIPPEEPGISPSPGIAATELVPALESGEIRVVWVVATNPVVSQPDAERFAAALKGAELVIAQDAYHPTETSALAHLLLPAAQWPEKQGTMTNSERRVTLMRRALAPPGQALPDWQIFARVARALGYGDAFSWQTASEVFDEFVTTTEGRLCDMTGLSHERLAREGPIQWPCPRKGPDGEGHVGTDRLYGSLRFSTPDGRARLAPTPHVDPVDAPDAQFPLVLTTGRVAGQWHTMTRTGKSKALLEGDPEPFVELHPQDAERLGVRDGKPVTIRSRRGAARAVARITDGIPPGVAFAPMHWGALYLPAGAGAINGITSPAIDPTSKQAELKACAVAIGPAIAKTTTRSSGGRRVLIAGGGMAAAATAESALAHDPSLRITMVAEEIAGPYNRVGLSSLLAGNISERELALHDPDWYSRSGVALRTGARVDEVDIDSRRAWLSDGDTIDFDDLVLATGSRPAVPPISGLRSAGVHMFRSLHDVRAILEDARTARHAVVIGGGLLGLEAARGLRTRGADVTVVHLASHLMESQLDDLGGMLLSRAIERLGIRVLTGQMTEAVLGDDRVEAVLLAGGEQLPADLVVVATGIVPETSVARAAGLEVRRGVVVDDEMRTDAPGVWAVGECAEHRGVAYGIWSPLRRQSEVAGATLAGVPAAFHGMPPATTLKVADIPLFAGGRAAANQSQDEIISLDTRAGRYRKLVLEDGRLVGAILLGDVSEAGRLHELLRTGTQVDSSLLAGALTGPAEPSPDDLICSCESVDRGTIERAIAEGGLQTVAEVSRATGSTTGCGGCRPHVEAILAESDRQAIHELHELNAVRGKPSQRRLLKGPA